MSKDYIESRIRAALKQHNGNAHNARKQIIAWTYEDTKLLEGLAKPHLSGIVAYNIERTLSAIEAEKSGAVKAKPAAANSDAPKQQKPPAQSQAKPSAKKEDAFGMQLLKAVAGSNEVFGFDSGRPAPRPKASKRHSDILRHIAVDIPKD